MAQAILETGWGKDHSGVNNLHGIKGKGTTRTTHEYIDGKRIQIDDDFLNFRSPVHSFRHWAGLMQRKYPGVVVATSFDQAVQGLKIGKKGEAYATELAYEKLVKDVHKSLDQIECRFVLVTGDCDDEVGARDMDASLRARILEHPLLDAWFAQNCNDKNRKLHPLPIGMDYHTLTFQLRHRPWVFCKSASAGANAG